MRIVADRDIPQIRSAFSDIGDVELVSGRTLTAKQLDDAEILLVRSVTRVDANLLEGTNVSYVGTATSGIDHLDTEYLRQRGISYFDAAGCNARAVAEYVLACSFLHGQLGHRDPSEIKVGIIGYGHVGTIVHSMLSALGLNCVINDPPLERDSPEDRFVEIDEALTSDIVTLHVPYSAEGDFPTAGLIGVAQLSRTHPNVLLINAARGGVIDEQALISWLDDRSEARVAIDCWTGEPAVDLRLLGRAAIATPHIAGHTIQARLRATTMLREQFSTEFGIAPKWRAPQVDLLELRLRTWKSHNSIDVLDDAVLSCCDPRIATADMRNATDFTVERWALEFDELRRKAAKRCEFSAYRVACNSLQSDTVSALTKLGFNTTMNDTTHGE